MVWFTHRVVCTLLVKHMTTDNIRDTDRLDLDNNVSLTDLIEGSGLDAADDINEPILFQNSPFFNNSELINFLSTKNNSFIILSLNAQSLNAKYDTIKHILICIMNVILRYLLYVCRKPGSQQTVTHHFYKWLATIWYIEVSRAVHMGELPSI